MKYAIVQLINLNRKCFTLFLKKIDFLSGELYCTTSLNIDAINIMIAKVLILQEPQDLVMALSMILLKSTLYYYLVLPNHHHLLLIV